NRAVEMGFDPRNILFAGVGKTDKEIKLGLKHDIFAFNVESLQELKVLDQLSGVSGKKTRFALRINPNVDAGTHEYITTGKRDNKFGITLEELNLAIPLIKSLEHTEFIGIHFHIGSQIMDLSRFKELVDRCNEVQRLLLDHSFELPHINVGGGLGIDYDQPETNSIADFKGYFDCFKKNLALLPNQTLHFELGRSLVAQCGSLIARVLYIKPAERTSFMILDAGMTELIRPALYRSFHFIENLSSQEGSVVYDVVGPICETSDAFARGLSLPETKRGDMLAIRSAGAYGEVMASQYNLREVAPSIFSDDFK
ncbi:diaminopimelate decarboxylase, partial [Cyclobacteriaceae bacterium]|nr:diaminopimelate decarboxylase [Cyclobacteriaceae bacterium]